LLGGELPEPPPQNAWELFPSERAEDQTPLPVDPAVPAPDSLFVFQPGHGPAPGTDVAEPDAPANLGGLGTALREVFSASVLPFLREMRSATGLPPSLRLTPEVLIVAAGSALFLVLLLLTNVPSRVPVASTPPLAPADPPLLIGFDVSLTPSARTPPPRRGRLAWRPPM
jgi:hypothetical protein